jgi:predicted amidohydrolase YtcJ
MAGDRPEMVAALAAAQGRITFTGTVADAMSRKGPDTKVIDLGGQTLLPGFLDGHGHYINSLAVASQCCVYPPPSGVG